MIKEHCAEGNDMKKSKNSIKKTEKEELREYQQMSLIARALSALTSLIIAGLIAYLGTKRKFK